MVSGSHLVGSQVDQYEVKQILGRGGMGTVYEGLHPLIHKRVAIKVLHPHFSRDVSMVGRFISEARAVNAIGHRGIIDIFAFGQLPGGENYFVMELLEGRSLEAVIKGEGKVSVERALAWADEILDALGAAHAAGVVHRDLKPSNLFLVEPPHGKPYMKILDFGIAKLLTTSGEGPSESTGMVGTPTHISPEQVTGGLITHATDLYAFGCVLFELLSGAPPFVAEGAMIVMNKHLTEVPPLLSERASNISPELDNIVAELLRKQPSERPASAQAVRKALAEVPRVAPSKWATDSVTKVAMMLPDRPPVETTPRLEREASDASLAPLELTPLPPRVVGETRVAPSATRAEPAPGSEPTDPAAAPLSTTALSAQRLPTSLPAVRPASVPATPQRSVLWLAGGAFVMLALAVFGYRAFKRAETTTDPLVEIPIAAAHVDAGRAEAAVSKDSGTAVVALPAEHDAGAPQQPVEMPIVTAAQKRDAGTVSGVRPTQPRGPTRPQLEARLTAFERKLIANEQERGDKDLLLRGQLTKARAEVRGARSPQELSAAERRVASLEQLLR